MHNLLCKKPAPANPLNQTIIFRPGAAFLLVRVRYLFVFLRRSSKQAIKTFARLCRNLLRNVAYQIGYQYFYITFTAKKNGYKIYYDR
jgi:hypothetical protein